MLTATSPSNKTPEKFSAMRVTGTRVDGYSRPTVTRRLESSRIARTQLPEGFVLDEGVRQACTEYATALLANGYVELRGVPCYFAVARDVYLEDQRLEAERLAGRGSAVERLLFRGFTLLKTQLPAGFKDRLRRHLS